MACPKPLPPWCHWAENIVRIPSPESPESPESRNCALCPVSGRHVTGATGGWAAALAASLQTGLEIAKMSAYPSSGCPRLVPNITQFHQAGLDTTLIPQQMNIVNSPHSALISRPKIPAFSHSAQIPANA